ncbi:hypothetical protein [Okeania sp. KiyG1]|nr:hypothetical protein [Okeania sp. KiyG1]
MNLSLENFLAGDIFHSSYGRRKKKEERRKKEEERRKKEEG